MEQKLNNASVNVDGFIKSLHEDELQDQDRPFITELERDVKEARSAEYDEDVVFDHCLDLMVERNVGLRARIVNGANSRYEAAIAELVDLECHSELNSAAVIAMKGEVAVHKLLQQNKSPDYSQPWDGVAEFRLAILETHPGDFRKLFAAWNEVYGYVYRNLPTSDDGWSVSGHDELHEVDSDVLEWCTDSADAAERLTLMQAYSNRFKNLKVTRVTV